MTVSNFELESLWLEWLELVKIGQGWSEVKQSGSERVRSARQKMI